MLCRMHDWCMRGEHGQFNYAIDKPEVKKMLKKKRSHLLLSKCVNTRTHTTPTPTPNPHPPTPPPPLPRCTCRFVVLFVVCLELNWQILRWLMDVITCSPPRARPPPTLPQTGPRVDRKNMLLSLLYTPRLSVCVTVCVCVSERERERERSVCVWRGENGGDTHKKRERLIFSTYSG
jgi:hypothetical protein